MYSQQPRSGAGLEEIRITVPEINRIIRLSEMIRKMGLHSYDQIQPEVINRLLGKREPTLGFWEKHACRLAHVSPSMLSWSREKNRDMEVFRSCFARVNEVFEQNLRKIDKAPLELPRREENAVVKLVRARDDYSIRGCPTTDYPVMEWGQESWVFREGGIRFDPHALGALAQYAPEVLRQHSAAVVWHTEELLDRRHRWTTRWCFHAFTLGDLCEDAIGQQALSLNSIVAAGGHIIGSQWLVGTERR
jgi:hypothetical protein